MEVDVTVTVPAAAKKVGDSLLQLLGDLKAKKSVIGDSIALVETAVAEFSELQAEAHDPQLVTYCTLLAGQLIQALVAPAPAAAPAAPAAPVDASAPAPAPAS